MGNRPIERRIYIKARAEYKIFLNRNYDPTDNDPSMGPPSSMFVPASVPFMQRDVFLQQMVKEGIVIAWMGGYADARHFAVSKPDAKKAEKATRERLAKLMRDKKI